MERDLLPFIRKDLLRKIVLVSGPRQSGKTTLVRSVEQGADYLNYDYAPHRLSIRERSWDRTKKLVIFGELHKMRGWKSWLKGIWDVEGAPPSIIITASARLDVVRKTGDSLAGRFFSYRLHPFDVREVAREISPPEALSRLMRVGGFPEPFLENDESFHARWQRSHIDIILRQDLADLQPVRDVLSIETLIELLKRRVGSPVSCANLARGLERDPGTVKRWLGLLENLYVVFAVRPWHRNVARSLLKEPEYYFFDPALVSDEKGARFENVCACALLKEIQRQQDCVGTASSLHYLRTRDGRELDFLVAREGKPPVLLEAKLSDDSPSPAFRHFDGFFRSAVKVQLVRDLPRDRTYPDGREVRDAARWLARLPI